MNAKLRHTFNVSFNSVHLSPVIVTEFKKQIQSLDKSSL
jgi:hypothetical protein